MNTLCLNMSKSKFMFNLPLKVKPCLSISFNCLQIEDVYNFNLLGHIMPVIYHSTIDSLAVDPRSNPDSAKF